MKNHIKVNKKCETNHNMSSIFDLFFNVFGMVWDELEKQPTSVSDLRELLQDC